MRISKIKVNGLFDRFDHEFGFKTDERIGIILGPNGIGKTAMLQILFALFNNAFHRLERMPFDSMSVLFDDGSNLQVSRKKGKRRRNTGSQRLPIEISYSPKSGSPGAFSLKPITSKDLHVPILAIEDVIPALEQTGSSTWRQSGYAETLSLDDVIELYGEQLLRPGSGASTNIPKWMHDITEAIPVHFITAERLTTQSVESDSSDRRSAMYTQYGMTRRPTLERTVRRYSEELGKRVQETLARYGNLSQSLDSTFPARLVAQPVPPSLSVSNLQDMLVSVDAKRARMVEVGILAQELGNLELPLTSQIDAATLGVLAVYVSDAMAKLQIFDDLYARVDTLRKIINSRYQHKQLNVGPEGIRFLDPTGVQVVLETLSSGEQHQLVLLYDLLFRVKENSLILIDEPELSLHVAWQEEFLADLGVVAQLSNFSVLLATHSPQIIGERWDLTIELKGSNGS